MSRLVLRFVLGAAIILFPTVSCVGPREDPTNPNDPNGSPEVGESHGALCLGTTIGNVIIQPGTFHWEDPFHLITLAEGCGPQSLGVSVSTSVSPTYSIVSNYVPADSEISTALGYSVTQTVSLSASANMLVPTAAYGWLEAYPSFQKSTWNIIGVNCYGPGPNPVPQMIVGTGEAYRPIGVFFKPVRALDCGAVGGVIDPGPFPIAVPSGAGGAGSGGAGAGSGGAGGGGSGTGGAGGAGGGNEINPFPIVVPTGGSSTTGSSGSTAGSSSSATGINPYPIVIITGGSGAGGAGGDGSGGNGGTGG